jgi:hypothetical protein
MFHSFAAQTESQSQSNEEKNQRYCWNWTHSLFSLLCLDSSLFYTKRSKTKEHSEPQSKHSEELITLLNTNKSVLNMRNQLLTFHFVHCFLFFIANDSFSQQQQQQPAKQKCVWILIEHYQHEKNRQCSLIVE